MPSDRKSISLSRKDTAPFQAPLPGQETGCFPSPPPSKLPCLLGATPGDEVDSGVGSARGEELQREPPVPGLLPPAHLLPQALVALGIQDRGGASRAVLGALAPAAAPAIRLGAGASAAGGLIDHGAFPGKGREAGVAAQEAWGLSELHLSPRLALQPSSEGPRAWEGCTCSCWSEQVLLPLLPTHTERTEERGRAPSYDKAPIPQVPPCLREGTCTPGALASRWTLRSLRQRGCPRGASGLSPCQPSPAQPVQRAAASPFVYKCSSS